MRSLQKKMMDYCTYCPKMCRFSCPVSEVTKTETFTPWGKMQNGRWILEKNLPLSEGNVLSAYQCTNCLHCQNYCEHHNDVPEALREIRKLAVENYAAPKTVFDLEKRFSSSNNPYGMELNFKKHARYLKEKPEVLFFPSCHTRRYFPDRIHAYFRLFEKLKIPDVGLTNLPVPCCGEPLRALGLEKPFREVAEVQYHSLKPYGCIVTDDSECSHSFKVRYAGMDLPVGTQVLHLLEFLEPFLMHSNYRTQGKSRGRFLYLDPPFLSRYQGLAELPRRILSQVTGFKPQELSFHGSDCLSTGLEGGYAFSFPELSEALTRRIGEEIKSRRVRKVLTSCPQTEIRLRGMVKGVDFQDLVEFIDEQVLPA